MNLVISTRTIFTSLLMLSVFWILYQVKEVVLLFFVALIISMALLPFIERLESRGFSRSLATLLVYFSVIIIFLAILGTGISPMVEQTTLFLSQLPRLIESVLESPLVFPISRQVVEELTRQLASVSVNIVKITLGIFDSFLAVVTVFVFSFYFSLGYEEMRRRFASFFPEEVKRKINESLNEIEKVIGGWVRGEFVLMVVIAVFSYIGLSVLRVGYVLPLSLIAGVLEIVPIIGPLLSAIPAAVVGFSSSSVLGFGVIALYIIIQQLENNLIVPRVMERAVGLSPLLTISVIFIGGKLFGIVGALLAVPVVLILRVIIPKFFFEKR
ncbi:MAG: hypothetical protein A2048_10785 [Deltaproteobacteria bacterium GWA2_45_12]|nr:MAG: hypothetical protein A2048_10785 [Deltaproteobacteria bacterium GWA2_45_12]